MLVGFLEDLLPLLLEGPWDWRLQLEPTGPLLVEETGGQKIVDPAPIADVAPESK